jgi:predicted nucleic acid-binding protein
MKLVVDANVLIAALIKNGTSCEVIMSGRFTLVSPDFMSLELGNHIDLVSRNSGLSTKELAILLTLLLKRVQTVPISECEGRLEEARKLMEADIDDVPYVACYLSLKCDGIWTNGSDFKRTQDMKIYQTADLLKLL